MRELEVQCLCGAVAVKISGAPIVQVYCHCDDCQTAHGAAYIASAVYPAQAVDVQRGELKPLVVKSTSRLRCGACGTFVFSELPNAGLRAVNAMLLPKSEFKPQFHIQCQHALLPVVDDLPHYKAFPPMFGGSDERVAW